MKPTVYIETTIISYLTAWPSNDAIRQEHQHATRIWWDTRHDFELVSSALVIREASRGDPQAAADRLKTLEEVRILRATESAERLTQLLLDEKAIPASVPEDAAHIAIAAAAGVQFLLTWNCRHIANAFLRRRIEEVIRGFGFEPPTICTPDTLLGDNASDD